MQDHFNSPIFILGLPRSGTSMIAGAIRICGAWTGVTVPASQANPKGFFEHTVIREHVTKQVLTGLGCDPLGVRKIPPVYLPGQIPGLADIIQKIIYLRKMSVARCQGFQYFSTVSVLHYLLVVPFLILY